HVSVAVHRGVLGAPMVLEPGMLGTDSRVVQAGRYRMRFGDLPVGVLQEVGAVAVQNAGGARAERGSVPAACQALAGRLHADQPDVRIADVRVENTHGI